MKVSYGESALVASSGVQNQGAFTIAVTGKAFEILSSGLYTRKIGAAIRELSCNAADAHIAAGKPDLPIEVKLPNALDPMFYVKDWGIGLSEEEVFKLYTSYFSSTKADSDEYTGAFGLGSKSPFAYTDSFTVVAVKDGLMKTFTAYKDQQGIPSIALLGVCAADPDWQTGVMVSFPVRTEDHAEFKREAQDILSWFSVRPVLLGGELNPAPEYALTGPNWGILPAEKAGGTSLVIMGNVAYPIQLDSLPVLKGSSARHMMVGLHLRLPIGTVNVAASREELQYDEHTRRNLKAAMDKLLSDMVSEWIQILRDPTLSGWECRQSLRKVGNTLSRAQWDMLDTFLTEYGTSLTPEERTRLCKLACSAVVEVPAIAGTGGIPGGARVYAVSPGSRENTVRSLEVISGVAVGIKDYKRLDAVTLPIKQFKIMVGDAPYARERVRDHVLDNDASVLLVMPVDGESDPAAHAKLIADAMGGAPVGLVSTLEVPLAVEARKAVAKQPSASHLWATALGDRAIRVLNLGHRTVRLDALEDYRLSAIPADQRWYLLADSSSPNRGSRELYVVEGSHEATVGSSKYDTQLTHVTTLLEQIVPGKYKQVALVTQSELKRNKMVEMGFRQWIPAVIEDLQSDKARQHLQVLAGLIADVAPSADYWQAGKAGLVHWLVAQAHTDSLLWKEVLSRHLAKYPFLEALLNTAKSNHRGLIHLVAQCDRYLRQFTPNNVSVLNYQGVLISRHQVEKQILRDFPLLRPLVKMLHEVPDTKEMAATLNHLMTPVVEKALAPRTQATATATPVVDERQLPLQLAA